VQPVTSQAIVASFFGEKSANLEEMGFGEGKATGEQALKGRLTAFN
jgi:hypothetical protein